MKVFFSLYMAALSSLGAIVHRRSHATAPQNQGARVASSRTFEEADQDAKALGDLYRGAGIGMVGLGALIVLCAVAPLALEVDHGVALWWGVAEISLMVLVLAMAAWLKAVNIRRRWIDARHLAESLRYGALESRMVALSKAVEGQADTATLVTALHQDLTEILDSQITYNEARHAHYERIEHGATVVGIAVFASALVAALAHLVVHWPWLLFFTVAGPTLAGAVHGINGFLRIADMSDDHREMAHALRGLQTRLNECAALPVHAAQLLQTSSDVHRALLARDAQWRGKADTLQPKLG